MKGSWYFPQVIRVRPELTANGFKDHCYDVLIPDIIGLTDMALEVCPSNVCPFYQI